MTQSNTLGPSADSAREPGAPELTQDQLEEVERRVDHMLDIAWSAYQTISTDPKRLAALRRYLTDVQGGGRIQGNGNSDDN